MSFREGVYRVITLSAAFALVVLSGNTQRLHAQGAAGSISGRVVDAQSQQPLANVQVYVPQTSYGTITRADGRYQLTGVPAGQYTVHAQVIGYARSVSQAQVTAGAVSTVDFAMEASRIELDEIVVSVEAGAQSRKELGTDIGRVDVQEAVQSGVVSSMTDVLQSRAPGVNVAAGGGQVGAPSRVRIRGAKSLTRPNTPLLVVDGMRVAQDPSAFTTSRLDDINPDDIANIQIIKGAAATALYGSEAAPGVIVVTTKRGAMGTPRINFRSSYGIQTNPYFGKYPDVYADVTQSYGVTSTADPRISGMRSVQHPLTNNVFIMFNPLQDPLTNPFSRDGRLASIGGDISGGNEGVTYFLSADYGDDLGLHDANWQKSLNLRSNVDFQMTDRLDVQANAAFYDMTREHMVDGNGNHGLGVGHFLATPTLGLDREGRCMAELLRNLPLGSTNLCLREGSYGGSYDDVIYGKGNLEDLFRATASARLTWRPTDWLTNLVTIGHDRTGRDLDVWTEFDPDLPFNNTSLGVYDFQKVTNAHSTFDYTGTITREGDALDTWTTFGAQYFSRSNEVVGCVGREFPTDAISACQSAFLVTGEFGLSEQKELGMFAQQRVGWNDYLFVTGAIRRDDNAALGADVGAIWSPSFNASLVMSDMPFWNVPYVDELRLRGAWGTASQSPAPYVAERTAATARVTVDGELLGGLSPANPGNPNLGPERSAEFEAGFDATLFERLSVTFSYFDVTTTDLIVPVAVAPSTGFTQTTLANLGEMHTTGLELALEGDLITRPNFVWGAAFTHSQARPIVTDVGLDVPIILPQNSGGSRSTNSQVFANGFAPGSYISPVITHAERDANGNIIPSSIKYAPGNLNDGTNLRVVGSPHPDGTQTLSTNVTLFGNLQFAALFDRVYGVDVYNVTRGMSNPFSTSPVGGSFGRTYAFRQIEMTPVEQAMVEARHHAAHIERGDYVKFRELSARWAFPERFASRLGGADAASIRIAGRNLHTWSDFSILDPEMDVRGGEDSFTRNNFLVATPPLRTLMLEVNLSY